MRRFIFAVLLASATGSTFAQTSSVWNGFYGGLSLGGRWADVDWKTTAVSVPNPVDTTTNTANYDSSAFRVGGFLGHNWQVAPLWVAGIEADLGWANNKKRQAAIPGTHGPIIGSPTPGALANDNTTVELKWDGSLRGRVGYLVSPETLLYLSGGLAWQKIEVSASCIVGGWCSSGNLSQSNRQTRSGWALGAGVERVVSNNWVMRAEYRYADYGSMRNTFFGASGVDDFSSDVKSRTHTASLGMVFRFK